MANQSVMIGTNMKIKIFETLSGAAFMKMESKEIAALSRDELVRLAFRVRAIMAAIATYMRGLDTTEMANFDFDIQLVADFESMKTQDIAALSKEELETLALRGQEILQRCPIKPGCRFCSLPDEYYLHVLLEWLTIEDQARFDMALLNHMDRRAHMHLLRDTEHGGVLSVSGKMNASGYRSGYKFDSGVCAWLESRNVFMRAVKFQKEERDIPAGFLARIGRQVLKLDLSKCCSTSDAELGKLAARCPRLEEVTLFACLEITDAALASLAQQCPRIHTVELYDTKVTAAGVARLGGSCRNIKRLILCELDMSDAGLGKIAEMCPNVEEVDLRGCRSITDVGLSSLVMRCQHIHTLDLSNTQINGVGLARHGDGCVRLTKISLCGLAIPDAGLGTIAEMCPNLEEVRLVYCSMITDVGATNLAQRCPKLRKLDLSRTRATAAGVASLREAYPALAVTKD